MVGSKDLASRLGDIVIIGCGKMGEAILAGVIGIENISVDQVTVAEPSEDRCAYITETYGVRCVADASEASSPDTAILAIKPQVLREILSGLADCGTFVPGRIISVAAGISTSTICEFFPEARVIRAMPNTPLMVGKGMVGLSVAEGTPLEEGELARDLFSLMGEAVIVDEPLQEGIVAISGSGPAYFALFVSELAKAGEELGIPADLSLMLSLQTMAGTVELMQRTGQTPEQLIEAVSSPGGTTVAALEAMRLADVGEAIRRGALAAAERSRELS